MFRRGATILAPIRDMDETWIVIPQGQDGVRGHENFCKHVDIDGDVPLL